ncbi:MAG TPA: glycerate kinase [Actinomycetota bacterium]|nr:glycerate kinase [Actinomycetota bacterium]
MGGHVVVAPDKFKGSLGAPEVARAVADGLRAAVPGVDVREHPVADGGDGTVEAALSAGYDRHEVRCAGPTGEPVTAALAVAGEVAVVELAEASGLRRLPGGRPAALTATSRGTGELIRAALDLGCGKVVLGIGGSACTDGGAGMVQALGGRLLDAAGAELAAGGAALADLDRLDLSGFDPRVGATGFVIASDVDNPLLGLHGAAAVYGPQKGASPADVRVLDAALTRWAAVARTATGVDAAGLPGAGAAGGVGFAAVVFLGARIRSGIDYLLDLLQVRAAISGARLVVTGEGSLDAQTLRGKAPAGVAAAARDAGVTTVAVAGRSTLDPSALEPAGIARAYVLSDLEPDPERSMREPAPLLRALASRIAADWLGGG